VVSNSAWWGGGAYCWFGTLNNCMLSGNSAVFRTDIDDAEGNNIRHTCASEGLTHCVNGCITNVPGAGPRKGVHGSDSMQDTNQPPKGPFYRLEVENP